MSYTNREVSNFKVELIEGGQIGVETKIRISCDILVESVNDEHGTHDWAVSQAYIKYWILANNWNIAGRGKEDNYVTDYSRTPGANAVLDWHVEIEHTFIPETVGLYYVPCRIVMFSNHTVGDNWPPTWNDEYSTENPFGVVEITEFIQSFDVDDFLVTIGQNTQGYDWDGLVLNESVDQTGIIDGHEVRVVINSGTLILGTGEISLEYVDDVMTVLPLGIKFSNQPDIYVDGVLV